MQSVYAYLLSSFVVVTAACTPSTGPATATGATHGADANALVTVEILGAGIAPGKADGMSWDGVPATKIPPEADAEIRKTLAEPEGTKKVTPLLAKLAAKGIEPPDPQGTAQAFAGDTAQGTAQKLTKVENSFTPTWSGVRIEHLKLDPGARIHVHLEDADEGAADLIGEVDLDAAKLRDALTKDKPTDVRFEGDASHVLYLTIRVRAE
jgi:hypothetical protein